MSRENRRELGRIPTSPETQVDTIEKKKVEVLQGSGTSDRPIVLRGRESRPQERTKKKRNCGEGVDDRS